jgi:hypothetical protein
MFRKSSDRLAREVVKIALRGVLFGICILLLPGHVFGQTVLLGDQTIERNIDSSPTGTAEAFQSTATTSGQVGSVILFLDAGSNAAKVVVGIYSDSNGHPGTLLTQGSTTQLAAGTWNLVTVTSIQITSATQYWLTILGTQSGTLQFRDHASGSCLSEASSQTTLTTLPNSWTTGTVSTTCSLSGYVITGTSFSGSVLIGNQAKESSTDSDSAGMAEAFPAPANSTGTVATISLFLDSSSGSGPVLVGLYNDNSGHPGTLLGQGSTTQPVAGSWNQIAIAPSNITAGQQYWIALLGTQTGSPVFRNRTSAPCSSETSSQSNLSAFPNSWTTGQLWTTCYLSAYGLAASGGQSPTISGISPTSGPVGTSVTITGTNFGSSQGTSTVTFNGTAGTPTIWSTAGTSITVPMPSGATTGNVVVTVSGAASNGVAFTVIPPPTITSFTPTSASVGTLISVTGTNFNANNAIPTVTLSQQGGGTIPASVSSFTATNVSFVIPTGAATGSITVTANGLNAVSSTSLAITAASSFTLSATPSTATILPGQTTTYEVSLASTNGFSQLASLAVSGLPFGVTGTFQPTQITAGQFSILTITAPSGQAPGASGLAITATAVVQGITQAPSMNVTLQVQGTSGVAFAGRVAVTDSYDTPLVGLTVKMLGVNQNGVQTGCTGSITSDASGNFVLNGLSASCAGGQLIQYDPSTVTSPTGTYSGVTLSYQLVSGQVTTPGPPGFIVHLPRVDNAETFRATERDRRSDFLLHEHSGRNNHGLCGHDVNESGSHHTESISAQRCRNPLRPATGRYAPEFHPGSQIRDVHRAVQFQLQPARCRELSESQQSTAWHGDAIELAKSDFRNDGQLWHRFRFT